MELNIAKNTGKPHIILYKRDNGSETWMKADDFFVHHDLSHFALEKTLHYTTAFMGMINSGMDIKEFEDREKRKQLIVTGEAVFAENMANLFLIEIFQGRFNDFNETVRESFKQMNGKTDPPLLQQHQIDAVRNYILQLINQWKMLPAGQSMKLIYNLKP
ncbi:MAG TPA: hypothetical protein VMT76_07950 [Puia sp.]|nr:hypothetical protein [Puia sp.]